MSEQVPERAGGENVEETTPEVDPDVIARREELLRVAQEATAERPELARLVEQVARLDEVELSRHVELLDDVHRGLRDALAAAGRDDATSA